MTDFRPTPDQAMLREGFKQLLDGTITEPRRRATLDGAGLDREVWAEIAAGGWLEIGLPGVVEDGSTAFTLALLSEELGAHLVPAPVSLVAAWALPLLARAPAAVLDLEEASSGRALVTVAAPSGGSPSAPHWEGLRVEPAAGGGLCVSGRLDTVPLGASADWVLVPLELPGGGGVAVAAVATGRDGVRVLESAELDFVMATSALELDSVVLEPAELLAGGEDVGPVLREWLLRYLVCLDCESVGAAEAAIAATVAYVGDRRQFGVPVGSFQAVKHLLADAYGEMEFSRGLARHVAYRLDHDPSPPLADLLCSRLLASGMYPAVVERCIQCQGGAGFTWEQGMHAWYRQALFLRSHPFGRGALRREIWAEMSRGALAGGSDERGD